MNFILLFKLEKEKRYCGVCGPRNGNKDDQVNGKANGAQEGL